MGEKTNLEKNDSGGSNPSWIQMIVIPLFEKYSKIHTFFLKEETSLCPFLAKQKYWKKQKAENRGKAKTFWYILHMTPLGWNTSLVVLKNMKSHSWVNELTTKKKLNNKKIKQKNLTFSEKIVGVNWQEWRISFS